jgi:hypothetical protein
VFSDEEPEVKRNGEKEMKKKKKKRAVIVDENENEKHSKRNKHFADENEDSNLSLNVFPKLSEFSNTFSPEEMEHFSLDLSHDPHVNETTKQRKKSDQRAAAEKSSKRDYYYDMEREVGMQVKSSVVTNSNYTNNNNSNFVSNFSNHFSENENSSDLSGLTISKSERSELTHSSQHSDSQQQQPHSPKPSKLTSASFSREKSRDSSLDLERLQVWDPYEKSKRSCDQYFISELGSVGSTHSSGSLHNSSVSGKDSFGAAASSNNMTTNMATTSVNVNAASGSDSSLPRRASDHYFRQAAKEGAAKRDVSESQGESTHAATHHQAQPLQLNLSSIENQSPNRRRRASLKTENEQQQLGSARRHTQDGEGGVLGLSSVGSNGGSNPNLLSAEEREERRLMAPHAPLGLRSHVRPESMAAVGLAYEEGVASKGALPGVKEAVGGDGVGPVASIPSVPPSQQKRPTEALPTMKSMAGAGVGSSAVVAAFVFCFLLLLLFCVCVVCCRCRLGLSPSFS